MGYTRSWVPPTIPQRDDLTAWKALFTDVHDSLLLSGWTQTATAGQLVIADVATLPNDNTYAGFREYAWNDDWQATAPVVLQLYFGCGIEGLYDNSSGKRTRTPNLKTQVYFFGAKVAEFRCPQSYYNGSASTTTALTTQGYSLLCNHPDRGFFGVVYGAGSRNKPWSSNYGSYYGATWSLFLQRYLNDSGVPSDAGLAIYCPNLATNNDEPMTSINLARSLSISAPKAGPVISRDNLAPRVKRVGDGSDGQRIFVEPIYYYDGIPKPHPHLVSYLNTDITAGSTFPLTTALGVSSTFVALGNETCLSPGVEEYQRAGVAMLFE